MFCVETQCEVRGQVLLIMASSTLDSAAGDICVFCQQVADASPTPVVHKCGHKFHSECEAKYVASKGMTYETADADGNSLACPCCKLTAVQCVDVESALMHKNETPRGIEEGSTPAHETQKSNPANNPGIRGPQGMLGTCVVTCDFCGIPTPMDKVWVK